MILDPDFGVHASRHDGPEAMYRAALARAVLDLFGKSIPGADFETVKQSRREALYFLTREGGAWAESRRSFCDICGIDADQLRANVLRVLRGGEIAGADPRNGFDGIDIARELWAHEQGEPERAREQRKKQKAMPRQAPRRNAVASYSAVRSAILPLLSEPANPEACSHDRRRIDRQRASYAVVARCHHRTYRRTAQAADSRESISGGLQRLL